MTNQTTALTHDYLTESVNRLFSGTVDQTNNAIGIELEVFPFKMEDDRLNALVDVENEQSSGLCDLLKSEAAVSDQLRFLPKEAGVNQFVMKDGGLITFEPGGQVEFSSTIQMSLRSAFAEVKENIEKLHRILSPSSIWFFHGGMTPWHGVDEVGLKNTKPRYRAMDKYFKTIGPYGQQMMRLSTSIQVNLDFGEPDVAHDRWIAGNLMVPVLTAIFGNTPYFDNRPTGLKSYRSLVWQNLDKSRTGFPFTTSMNPLDEDQQKHYLEFALNANTVFLPDEAGNRSFQAINVPFKDWLESGFNGLYPEKKDWDDHVTLLFPEVRPKGFLEFRCFDGQSQAWWSIPALLLSAIIYDANATRRVIDLLSPYRTDLAEMLLNAAKTGVEAFSELAKQLFEIGLQADGFYVDDDLRTLMESFYKIYTSKGMNPSDLLLKHFPSTPPSPTEFSDFENRLLELADPPGYAAFSYSPLNSDRPESAANNPNIIVSKTETANAESCSCNC